ncbi:DUF3320 domain-containing protein [Lysobacter sp. M2-1]|uniref:DUF3320 domain-containing protein n=1 Tax=Lysobacter sp. M2-1 TaxID=2916839 RepID=UPI001F55B684|nr:DUF3320 domain-containing protein [Lysobacter sp. M2-1]
MNDEVGVQQEEVAALRGSGTLLEKIERARLELLDLSTRNRLLHTPRGGRAKIVEVVNELAKPMYDTLVVSGKRFTFSAGRADPVAELVSDPLADTEVIEINTVDASVDQELIAQPDFELDESGRVAKHWDDQLQTRMTSSGLQKRLLDLYIDARTLEEEQGVNILFLAIGYLKWRAPSTPNDDRFAPLVLVPVHLERSNAGEKFHLRWAGEDIQANLSLQLYLHRQFELRLPDIVDFETLDIDAYLEQVSQMVSGKAHWEVLPNEAVLGLFSFAKFMMYRDLDPAQWRASGGFESRSSLRGVVSDGFPGSILSNDNINIDPVIPPGQMVHVVDCDSSQALVVHDVRRGTSILVQGPPGTGKSQTIANIIATAVADKKKVLFVAEKMAALDVVKRRLDQADIGVACLELHSSKANKRAVLDDLRRTWQLGQPRVDDGRPIVQQLTEARDELNEHAIRLHRVYEPAKLTPFEVFGHLLRLRREGYTTRRVELDGSLSWAPHEKEAREELLRDLVIRIDEMGRPADHSWAGVGIRGLLPNGRDRILELVGSLAHDLDTWRDRAVALFRALELDAPQQFVETEEARKRSERLVAAPQMGGRAFLAPVWDQTGAVDALIEELALAQKLHAEALTLASADALEINWSETQAALAELSPEFELGREGAALADINRAVDRILPDLTRLAQLLGERDVLTLDTAIRLAAIGERAATIPEIERASLVAHIWDRGVDSIEDLIEAVDRVQAGKRSLSGVFREAAWSQELEESRSYMATVGTSWLRVFNGHWRRSNRLVRSFLVNPKLPADHILRSLDGLIDAQAAQRKIAERDGQGAEAFGTGWQRERSDTSFLRGVANWMRSLRPLGSGVRERLADVADRQLASELAARVLPVLDEVKVRLTPISEALIAAERRPWGEETVLRRVPLTAAKAKTAIWRAALEKCRYLAKSDTLTIKGAAADILRLVQAQHALQLLATKSEQGESAFGLLWSGVGSDLVALDAATAWIHENEALRGLAARTPDATEWLAACSALDGEAHALMERTAALFSSLEFESADGAKNLRDADLSMLSTRLERWRANPEGLPQWVAYMAQAKEAENKGLKAVVRALASGHLATEHAIGAFQLAYYEDVLAKMVKAEPELGSFDGQKQSQKVAHFSQLDWNRMLLARRQVVRAHHDQVPQRGGATGPTAILLAEMSRQRRHMPIRQLVERCAPAIQALKPVFMMSPLSIAQFLPPGVLEFDLLVIDEASQVQPVDALGAVARAKQLVIVGDERQLPPTRFFAKVLGDNQNDDDEGAPPADVESILGLCRARGLPERMLRWHYRSRHQSLIAVSNREFYEDQLLIVPSPYTSEGGMGLRFNHLTDAIYDRGNTRTNPVEAKAVAEAVIEHARKSPNLSLGVATFSTQQRRAIVDHLEVLRRLHPETEGFFASHESEPFFVKSLENIQGDERDVIFISVGYGRDAMHNLTMNFGPLSAQGGERRLNVLISRAKSRCEVFSSITDEDIDIERAKGKGTVAFKLFLHYARTGRLAINGRNKEVEARVFEQEVENALKASGHHVHSHVGEAGLFVDIAVFDPKLPGRYILGIECDGGWYRDARSARDRERLREAALRDKGWTIYRVWSSEWFQRPQAELDRLIAAIEKAKSDVSHETVVGTGSSRAVPVEVQTVERGEFVEVGLTEIDGPSSADLYEEASFPVPNRNFELHMVPADIMAKIVSDVVGVEGPVHRDEVVARIRGLWGLQRAGGRIQSAIDAGIATALGQRLIVRSNQHFLSLPEQSVRVRDRSEALSPTLRRPD